MFNLYPIRPSSLATASSGVRRVVIVDRDSDHCAILLRYMMGAGFVVVIAHGWFEALSIIGRDGPELALFQRDGEDGDCDRAVALARLLYPETHVIQMDQNLPPSAGNPPSPAANGPDGVPDGGQTADAAAFRVPAALALSWPVSLPRLDDALRALSLVRAAAG